MRRRRLLCTSLDRDPHRGAGGGEKKTTSCAPKEWQSTTGGSELCPIPSVPSNGITLRGKKLGDVHNSSRVRAYTQEEWEEHFGHFAKDLEQMDSSGEVGE